MKNKKLLIIPVLIIAAIAASLVFFFRTDSPSGAIRLSGNIEVTDVEISFRVPGKIERRLVDEGETVRMGQIIARLDSADLDREVALRQAEVAAAAAVLAELDAGYRPEEVAQAAAGVQRAEALVDELVAGSRPQEVAAGEAAVAGAQAEVTRVQADYERQEMLYKKDVISLRDFQAARAVLEVAQARLREAEERLKLLREGPRREEIAQARAALAESRERYAMIHKGPRQETIVQARARLQQAREALALAETRLGFTEIVSPLAGVVLAKHVETGEFVAAGTPVVTVGDLVNVWFRGYIDESDLGRIRLGQSVRVSTDSRPGKSYTGKISFIAGEAEFTPKTVQTERERVKLVYRIKVDVQNPNMELKPNMPADAEISIAGQ